MKPISNKPTINISKSTKYKISSIVIFIGVLTTSFLGAFYSQKISDSINTKKLTAITAQINEESLQEQQEFFESNPEISETISKVFPDQDSIVLFVDNIEAIQESLNIPKSFEFSSMTPTKGVKNSYVSFLIKTNTTMKNAISFLRVFEKLPYLTRITSLSISTPEGVGGQIELSISARVYVQDPF